MNDRNPYRPAAYSASPFGSREEVEGDGYRREGGRGSDEEEQRYDRSPGLPSPYRDGPISPFGDDGGGSGGTTPVYNMRSRGRGGEEVEMRLQGGGYGFAK